MTLKVQLFPEGTYWLEACDRAVMAGGVTRTKAALVLTIAPLVSLTITE